MKPVDQSVLFSEGAIGNGDCFPACLASLLEIPLWMVPPFHQMYGRSDHYGRPEEWLKRVFSMALKKTDGHKSELLPRFYIANGPGPRGVYHSVIYENGKLAHDPHPSRSGILSVGWTWHLDEIQ